MSGLISNPCLYSAVHVGIVDRVSGEVTEPLYGEAAQYGNDIAYAMSHFKTAEYPTNDLMRYFSIPDDQSIERSIKEKVLSARVTACPAGANLYAKLEMTMSADLTEKELETLAE